MLNQGGSSSKGEGITTPSLESLLNLFNQGIKVLLGDSPMEERDPKGPAADVGRGLNQLLVVHENDHDYVGVEQRNESLSRSSLAGGVAAAGVCKVVDFLPRGTLQWQCHLLHVGFSQSTFGLSSIGGIESMDRIRVLTYSFEKFHRAKTQSNLDKYLEDPLHPVYDGPLTFFGNSHVESFGRVGLQWDIECFINVRGH
ncbi:hypothetical protein Vadar_002795 [Vaccinium darrowii]|uniref:Uncharacterized protein n=1 Tax=Vaccinium darrowii TaxID=229202 RepID=A0ACB7XEZ6_9ERIC|nr:hypothetical protein Vadar_002795 [Vaccinium darrowii]